MGWPREVLPVLQQPLCSLPVLAVATMLDVGALWLYDRQLQRIIPVAEGQRPMALLVGSKQLCTCGSLVAKWKCEVGADLGLSCALRCLCACLLCFLHAR